MRVIVAHPYRQHSYAVAKTVQEIGGLECYITCLYNKKHSFLHFLQSIALKKDKAKFSRYYDEEISESKVITIYSLLCLLSTALANCHHFTKISDIVTSLFLRKFNNKIARIAIKLNIDAIITFDTLSGDALKIITNKGKNITKIVDMSAPFLPEMYIIYSSLLGSNRIQKNAIDKKFNSKTYKEKIWRSRMELSYADSYLSASSFTSNSLEKNGVSASKIFIARYPLKQNWYFSNSRKNNNERKLKGIFVGNISFTKGAHSLILALQKCLDVIFEFVFIGAVQDKEILSLITSDKIKLVGYVQHETVIKLLSEADFSVFPSFADGFGFPVLESLIVNTPVICSRNAGASDLIIERENGYLFRAGDVNELQEKIRLVYSQKGSFSMMKNSTIESLTNECYKNAILNAITSPVRGKD